MDNKITIKIGICKIFPYGSAEACLYARQLVPERITIWIAGLESLQEHNFDMWGRSIYTSKGAGSADRRSLMTGAAPILVRDVTRKLRSISRSMLTINMNKKEKQFLLLAWRTLLLAYILSFAASFAAGIVLVKVFHVSPEQIYHVSTKRISYALPVIQKAVGKGIDPGILIFVWNTLGALATLSFLYTASLFNPRKMNLFPHSIRRMFCGRTRMKLFCFLPGCRPIEEESLRRVYVWLMVPLLGMILFGAESGFTVATSAFIFDSFIIAFISLLLHGIIEIPALALAGAVAYSAHLLLKGKMTSKGPGEIFGELETYRQKLPVKMLGLAVVFCLLSAGLVEGRLTVSLIRSLLV